MKTKIAKININNFVFYVYEADPNSEFLKINNKPHLGVCYDRSCEIYISNDLDNDIFKITLIHEITHAYISMFGIRNKSYDEEFICEFVALNSKNILDLAEEVITKRKVNVDKV